MMKGLSSALEGTAISGMVTMFPVYTIEAQQALSTLSQTHF
jgi:hypothetical protein